MCCTSMPLLLQSLLVLSPRLEEVKRKGRHESDGFFFAIPGASLYGNRRKLTAVFGCVRCLGLGSVTRDKGRTRPARSTPRAEEHTPAVVRMAPRRGRLVRFPSRQQEAAVYGQDGCSVLTLHPEGRRMPPRRNRARPTYDRATGSGGRPRAGPLSHEALP